MAGSSRIKEKALIVLLFWESGAFGYKETGLFLGESPSISKARHCFLNELGCWVMARAKHLGRFGIAGALWAAGFI